MCVLYLTAQSSACLPFCLLLKRPILPAFESSPHLSSCTLTEQISHYEDSAEEGFVSFTTRHYLQPPLPRIIQFEALISCRQQGTNVRKFALEFSGTAEGLGYNEAASKDIFNSALDEPHSWWRMKGQDHLTFGEFVEFLVCSPAKVRNAAARLLTGMKHVPKLYHQSFRVPYIG